jgi:hypothetical protein
MSISRDEAAAALGEIEQAGGRARTVQMYSAAAPFLILWGCIWLFANATVDLAPPWGGRAWMAGLVVGTVLTLYWTIRNSLTWKHRYPMSGHERAAIGRRASLLGVTLVSFFPAMLAVAGPLSGRQVNALISLLWAFVYMAAGAFIGWRLFAIGVVTAAAILFGYFFLHTHYGLWMAIVGGGALIAGGLWLRKI